jgi:sugar/nucleoside kinase (ribokinase family)
MKGIKELDLRYSRIVGAGGIGTGIFFKLDGMQTLGRNESRPGELMPYRDYCKLHIIFHYISIVLKAVFGERIQIMPLGMVGDDVEGHKLIDKMKSTGMDVSGVKVSNTLRTLFSVCFQYPDNTGGNITTSNSASYEFEPEDVDKFQYDMSKAEGAELFMAVPEVSVATRIRLLKIGKMREAFNAASLLSSEVEEFLQQGGFKLVDYLAINIDEAQAISGTVYAGGNTITVVELCIEKLRQANPDILVSITAGAEGSYCFDGSGIIKVPPLDVKVVSTAGAGDAYMAGVIIGLSCGLPFSKKVEDLSFGLTPLYSATELGTLFAAMSVTTPDTIHEGLSRVSLKHFAAYKNLKLSDSFASILGCIPCCHG